MLYWYIVHEIEWQGSVGFSRTSMSFAHYVYKLFSNNIIPWARMGSESIAHEAEGQMGYWLRDHEGERNNCFSKI